MSSEILLNEQKKMTGIILSSNLYETDEDEKRNSRDKQMPPPEKSNYRGFFNEARSRSTRSRLSAEPI